MKSIFLLLFLVSSQIFSQDVIVVDSLDTKIINLTFNDQFESVKSLCDSLIKVYPQNPKYYFHYFGADALQLHEQINSFPLNERDSLREVLVDRSIAKLESAIQVLNDIPTTLSDQFYIASLHGYYSRYAGLNRYWWAAYVNGTKANGMFEKIIEEHPTCYDAYLYPGVFGYYAARLNGFNGFIASILGVSGDREEGIQYIYMALKKSKLVYPQALLMMLEINTVMEDNPYRAIKYFEEFISKYPHNKRVVNWFGHTMLNMNRSKLVGKMLETDSLNALDNFVKAKYYFLTEQIDSSIKYSKLSFKKADTWKGIIEHTKYYCVYSNWLKGNPEAIKNYESKLDDFYSKLFELDIKNEAESKYIYKLTSLAVKEDYASFENLAKKHPIFEEVYFEAEYNLLKGTMLFEKGNYREAIPFLELAEKTTDFRKQTIALRYQLDVYLKIEFPQEKIEEFIERAEDTDFQKLIFRLDDLREKYKL